ncbi:MULTISPECIES: winged helix DNA-binding domain-containing protein [unclassified Kitasatospora]|uniref:winged helix DNA-binding domain-containing protein n=1 Tax=unclassified Kitasatospora TaxID=2633591 RepID=UPI000A8B81D2|nr:MULTISPECIES: winged helix DNA-binding domain-containing protein [unclassified Kitasatospora]
MSRVLTRQALTRAVLARQHLLARTDLTPAAMVEHLVGLQAQAVPDPPYLGLWSRLEGFRPDALTELLEQRAVVRVGLQRGTIHLVTADNCLTLRPLLQPVLDRALRGSYGKQLTGVDLAAVAARGRELVEQEPRTFQQLGALLGPEFPAGPPAALAQAVRALLPLVQVPPRGIWGRSGPAAHTTAEHWLGRPLDPSPSLERMVLRYLAAFGPATGADVQQWSGLTGLGPVLKRLAPELEVFEDEQGRVLYDLPDAPRPDERTPVPVRLLAPFDNLLLSHADRSRVVPEEYRRRVMTVNGLVPGTLLVDGRVAGVWRLSGGTLTIRPFAPLRRADLTGAQAEGARLLDFTGGERLVVEQPE